VKKPKTESPQVRRARKDGQAQAFVLVSEIEKFRDEGKISAAECVVWSSLIQSAGLSKNVKDQTSSFAILRNKRHWRLFRIRKPESGDPNISPLGPARTVSERALLIKVDALTGKLLFRVLGPAPAQSAQPDVLWGKHKRYAVKCRSCGWQIDNVKRLEKIKRRHLGYCPAAEFEIAPYVPPALINRPPGYSFSDARKFTQAGPVSRRKRTSNSKQGRIDRALSHREGLSAPDFYPDDN
jgi:hypothetical protein